MAEHQGRCAGFIIARTRVAPDGPAALIDLVAVDSASAGAGLGTALIRRVLAHYAGRACVVEVGTQGKNLPAMQLYAALGFRPARAELSLHWHGEAAAAAGAASCARVEPSSEPEPAPEGLLAGTTAERDA